MKKPRAALALVLTGLLVAPHVHADGAADGKQARALYNRGMTHFRLAEYDAAIQKWQDGFRLKPVPEFLYNIAQAYRLSKRPADAVTYYRQFLSMAPKTDNRAEVEQHITTLEAEIEAQKRAAVPPPVEPKVEPAPVVPVPAVDNQLVARAPERKPVYKKAWFWGVVGTGVVVVAAGVTLGVVLGTRSSTRTIDDVRFP